jgi:hypothetical protein
MLDQEIDIKDEFDNNNKQIQALAKLLTTLYWALMKLCGLLIILLILYKTQVYSKYYTENEKSLLSADLIWESIENSVALQGLLYMYANPGG